MIAIFLLSLLAFRAKADCQPSVTNANECLALTPNSGFDCCLIVEGQCGPARLPECPTPDPTSPPTTPAPTTPAPTTPAPTTPAPTTPAPTTPAPTTPAPTTPEPTTSTTEEITTTCYCPTPAPVTPAPTTSKDKGGSGMGCGNCDCDGGVTEIRYIYQDTVAGVNIRIFYDESRTQVLCNFNNVQPNDEVICPIAGNTASSAAMGLAKFAKETPFTITYPGGSTCEAQYHTSCSRDIVGIVQAECTKLVVSGWRGANSGDCDDCKEPCDCDATEYTTTWNPDIYATRIGEHCYCDNGCTPAPTSRRRLGKKSKGKKSKGSKGKGKTSNSGAGCGDCDCDKSIGMQMLRVRYSGSSNVNIYFYDKKGANLMCTSLDIDNGAEATCRADTAGFAKLETNTVVKVQNAVSGSECITEIHTSCSRDIVGTIGSADCGLLVTGWADDSECDDLYEECSCDESVLVYEDVDPYEEPEKEVDTDVCYCSTRTDGISSISQLTTTTRRRLGKKSKNVASMGVGSCDCDKSTGMQVLRFLYNGAETANSITVYYDKNMLSNEVVCSYTSVAPGDESECRIEDFTDASGNQIYGDFDTNTYLVIETDSSTCVGSIHTSCSRDIVGFAAENCDSVVVTGWADGDGDCDDGFDPCDCDSEYENAFRISAANGLASHVYVVLALVAMAAVFAF